MSYRRVTCSPGWCGSVERVLVCELKGHRFDSWSGHMPGLRASSPVGSLWEEANQCSFPSLSPSCPLSLKINKWSLRKRKATYCCFRYAVWQVNILFFPMKKLKLWKVSLVQSTGWTRSWAQIRNQGFLYHFFPLHHHTAF